MKNENKASKDLVEKLMALGKEEVLRSEEALREAAMKLGKSKDEIDKYIEELGGFPLDDTDLGQVSAGLTVPKVPKKSQPLY